MSDFIKIRPVWVELFQAGGQIDRQTDITKLIIAFGNFVNAPKNGYSSIFPVMQLNAPLNHSTSQHTVAKKIRIVKNTHFFLMDKKTVHPARLFLYDHCQDQFKLHLS
jgi:hypothetical protein